MIAENEKRGQLRCVLSPFCTLAGYVLVLVKYSISPVYHARDKVLKSGCNLKTLCITIGFCNLGGYRIALGGAE
jgi:hypothetical protein